MYIIEPYFNIIKNLRFESNSIFIPIKSFIQIPFYYDENKPYQCHSDPDLPDGLSFDLKSKIIKGITTTKSDGKYVITCSNNSTTTNEWELEIHAVDKFLSGLRASYLKVDNFDDECKLPYFFNDNDVYIEIIRREKSVNYEYNKDVNVWKGLSENFANNYAVNWNGYIKIDKQGIYHFKLSGFGAMWFYINDHLLYNSPGCNKWSENIFSKSLTVGYNEIKIIYLKSRGGSGIKLLWKTPDNEEYSDLDNFLFTPFTGDLEYIYPLSVYYIGKEIIENEIVTPDPSYIIKSAEIEPELPSGLYFNTTTGKISGTPICCLMIDKEKYSITINLEDDIILKSTITLEIVENIFPEGFYLSDIKSGERIDNNNITLGEIYYLEIKCVTGNPIKFVINDLPYGWKYDELLGRIIAVMNNSFDTLSVTAISFDDLRYTELIHFSFFQTCPTGMNRFIPLIQTYSKEAVYSEISIYEDNYLIYHYKSSFYYSYIYGESKCINQQKGVLKARSNIENEYIIIFFIDGSIISEYLYTISRYTQLYYINLISSPPNFTYPESLLFFKDNYMSYEPSSYNYIGICTISPDLPNGLSFNALTGTINGTIIGHLDNIEYKVDCVNDMGLTVNVIHITVYENDYSTYCESEGNVLLSITATINLNYKSIKYTIFYPDNSELLVLTGSEIWENNHVYHYTYCVKQGIYTCKRENLNSSYGWDGSTISLSVFGVLIGNWTMLDSEEILTDKLYLEYPIGLPTEWDYSYDYYEDWLYNNYSGPIWERSNSSSLYPSNKTTIYLRYTKIFKNQIDYSSFFIKLSYLSSIIFYINGEEIYRNYYENDDLIEIKFIMPISKLESEITIFALELHNNIKVDNFPQFKFMLLPFTGDNEGCTTINSYFKFHITEYSEELQDDLINIVDYGFDSIYNTYWIQDKNNTQEKSWTILRTIENTYFIMNYISVNAYSEDELYQPKNIKISGEENNEWKEIISFTNLTYPSQKPYKLSFLLYNETKLRNSLKFEGESESLTKFYVRDIKFYSCPIRVCKTSININLPESISNNKLTKKCVNTTGGERTFECPNQLYPKWKQINSNCYNDLPEIIYQEKEYIIKEGEKYNYLELVTFTGINLTYSMYPSINGLNINNKTGIIYGIPIENTTQLLKIIAEDAYNNKIEAVIMLIIKPVTNPLLIEGGKDVEFTEGDELYNINLFKVIGVDNIMIIGIPDCITFDIQNQSFTGILDKEGQYIITVYVNNLYGKLNFSFMFIVKPTIYPKIIYKEDVNLIYYETYDYLHPIKCVGFNIIYEVKNNLPIGINYDKETGILSGRAIDDPQNKSIIFLCKNKNGLDSTELILSITYSNYPIIVSYDSNVTIIVGKDYYDYKFHYITGENVEYSLDYLLPDGLIFNKKTGGINGFIVNEFLNYQYTLSATSMNITVSFKFELSSITDPNPSYVLSSLKENYTIYIGKTIKNILLFIPIGKEIYIKSNLPDGLFINNQTGVLYGSLKKYPKNDTYEFEIINSISSTYLYTKFIFIPTYCNKDNYNEKTLAIDTGNEIIMSCNKGKSGYKKRICYLNDNGNGEWSEVIDNCSISKTLLICIIMSSVLFLIVLTTITVVIIIIIKEQKRKKKNDEIKSRLDSKIDIFNDTINVDEY